MSQKRPVTWPALTVVVALFIGIVALPSDAKLWAPKWLQAPSIHFGLDLAGGTQLDFRISEEEMRKQVASLKEDIARKEAEGATADSLIGLQNQLASVQEQQLNVVEAIRTVLERRINALGVSEATITPSYIGNEKHLLVECPGIVDTQECIRTVGKTIQLEFKEEFTEPTEEFEAEVHANVTAVKKRLTSGDETFEKVGEDLSADLGISYQPESLYFKEDIPEGMEGIWNKKAQSGILQYSATVEVAAQDSAGMPTTADVPGIFLAEVLQARTQTGRTVNEAEKAFEILAQRDGSLSHQSKLDVHVDGNVPESIRKLLPSTQPGDLKTVLLGDGRAGVFFLRKFAPGNTEMEASHILVSYTGASSAPEHVTRTREEAQTFASELRGQLDTGAHFETLARTHSDGPSGAEGGSLGSFGIGTMVPAFEQAAVNLAAGEVSQPVETQFGFHIIRTDKVPTKQPDIVSYELLTITGEDASTRSAQIIGQLQRGDVESQEDIIKVRSLFFSLLPTGWKDTVLDGKHFRAATVTLDPTTNVPVVQISFDDEGGRIFQQMTKENIGKRIAIFVGGQLISAPTVQAEIIGGTAVITGVGNFDEARDLAIELNTGAIPAPIYLTGQRTVEATLGAEALRTSLKAALLGILILMAYMAVVYRLLGLLANVALMAYAVIFFAILKLPLFLFTSNHIVLTLAGMAGIILSIGMAVDANVLIFERMKEELKKGKMLKTAAETGFERAWPSIRDGNVSTFITCSILFLVGTSIVRGFAITLGMGVLISMFSAIVITRWLISKVADLPIAEHTSLFGVRRSKEP